MPIYPSGPGAAALAGVRSSASRPRRHPAAVRLKANGMGSYPGWVTSALTHPALAIVKAAGNLSRETALTEPRTAGRHRAPHPRARRNGTNHRSDQA
jgi:hypothetical protein